MRALAQTLRSTNGAPIKHQPPIANQSWLNTQSPAIASTPAVHETRPTGPKDDGPLRQRLYVIVGGGAATGT